MSAPIRNGPTISRTGSGLPSRVILHGVEGVGKSSFGACAPKPVFAMTRGETGLLTLIDNGQIPETDHFDECTSWLDLVGAVNYLIVQQRDNKTFVLDTLNGAERLCFEHVCAEKYGGSWDNFMAYGRGVEVAQAEWIRFLTLLDRLREARRMAIIALCHTRVKTFKNPEGDDFDRYTPDMHDKTWALAHKWADAILFGQYETFAKKDKGALKAKGIGGERRLMYTQRTAAYDAKNRLGLPAEIEAGSDARTAWNNFYAAAKRGRQQATAATSDPTQKGSEQ